LVDLEGHGRGDYLEGVDVSRTVGWFTCIYPVLLRKGESAGPGALLKSVKEQLRSVPRQGLGYGLLRFGGPAEIRAELGRGPQAEVSFTYLGQLDRGLGEHDALLGPADEAKGSERAGEAVRPYPVDVSAFVLEGRLHLAWQYASGLIDQASMESFADAYVVSLRGIIQHCLEPDAGGHTPSDFGLAMDQERLDSLLVRVSRRKRR
jgi:fengycin family lipopeptide synthetase B